ncbi:SLC13 family permease [Wenzhouxiangella sp. AB-CW3]|uniref:SLC13 family permease n=1 Tax=Wenzhouxiangella sp. AB-CW3 TaxID=2771012 RepID=UPI00168AC461|nr:SLC13 family permease [Wenzhouxiangella sp. AB-CW3]QOC21425.1 SLC13 family permease [Wenzhouxiangella sp. AB-CW3]
MTPNQITIVVILVVTMAMFIWGRWRHDMVAAGALLACVFFGLVPGAEAFEGFGHPAVITVACILILSRGLQTSGAVDILTDRLLPAHASAWVSTIALVILAGVLSAFMNNVGALALLMPVAIMMAQRHGLAPGQVLMPLAFGSILGGMTTLIGTPPNLIVSGFRAEAGLDSFAMFDFTPVGIVVAAAGIAFVLTAGRWLIPVRKRADVEDFDTGAYLTEVRVPPESRAVGMTVNRAEQAIEDSESQIVALIRGEHRMDAPRGNRKIRADDLLVIEAEPRSLVSALNSLGMRLEEDKPKTAPVTSAAADDLMKSPPANDNKDEEESQQQEDGNGEDVQGKERNSEEIALLEVVVLPTSSIIGRSARALRLRTHHGINLLAVSRQGSRTVARLRTLRFRPSDVLLVQGPLDTLQEWAVNSGCVPLADRSLRLPRRREAAIAGIIMLAAVVGAAFGLLPAAITFAAGVVAAMATRVVPPRKVYEAVDWPVIVLLGALIPVAGAMETTGTADLLAGLLLDHAAAGSAIIAIALLLIVTMTLSDFMNNAATAAVMCPIAISAARSLEASPDPFLMAVAVGASCAFLTPIGHQNNTLILGPGGFRFGDYWRLGLPLEVIVVAVGVPMILLVWPL